MEIPTGLKYLQSLHEIQHTQQAMHNIYEAAELLKDMAEALEKLTAYCDCHKDKEIKVYGCKEGTAVLNKFEEWK